MLKVDTDIALCKPQTNCKDGKMNTSKANNLVSKDTESTANKSATVAAAHVPVIAKAASCQYKVLMVSAEQAVAKVTGSQSATVNQPSTSALPGSKQSSTTAESNQCNGSSNSNNKDRESPLSSMDEGIEDMEDIDIDNKVCQTKQYCTYIKLD